MSSSARPHAAPTRSARGGLPFGSLFGVEIRLDWSLAIIFLLVLGDLALGVFPSWHPDWSPLTTWTTALAAAVLFFVSVVAHELSHALVGRAQGIEIRRVTLFLFGGMAHLEGPPRSPKAELLMAIVGPIVSLGIGVAGLLLGSWLAAPSLGSEALLDDPEAALAAMGPLATLALWLGPVNIVLGLFNLVPGFPLDGGRVLRAILWALFDDLERATRWATRAGQGFAIVLMGIGVVELFGGLWGQGLWLILIGWFLHRAARASYQQVLLRQALEEVPVAALMRRATGGVAPTTSVERLVRDWFMQQDSPSVLVRSEDGVVVGAVHLRDVRAVPVAEWSVRTVEEVMTPIDEVPVVAEDADAFLAFEALALGDADEIGVEREGTIVGVVRLRDVMRFLALRGPQLA